MKIAIFSHTANPQTDRPMVRKSRAYVLELLKEPAAFIIDGRTPETTRAVQLFAPVDRMARPDTVIESGLGWNMPPNRMQDSAINRGRVGQFPIGYEIPYAFEGHLTQPKASEVNFVPDPA